jgi:hypothetical protein
MIVTLKSNFRIVGYAAGVWDVMAIERAGQRTLERAESLQAAFTWALTRGKAEPGQPLDLGGFNACLADAGRRFESAASVRLGDGYAAGRVDQKQWLVTRDCGRGGKHAVQIGAATGLAAALNAAVWHAAFRERRTLAAPDVGPYLTGLAGRLLDGAIAGDDQ